MKHRNWMFLFQGDFAGPGRAKPASSWTKNICTTSWWHGSKVKQTGQELCLLSPYWNGHAWQVFCTAPILPPLQTSILENIISNAAPLKTPCLTLFSNIRILTHPHTRAPAQKKPLHYNQSIIIATLLLLLLLLLKFDIFPQTASHTTHSSRACGKFSTLLWEALIP